ncbi:hypothetical protein [Mycolicibacterium sphagni]|uniref:hypothetical protein n=1 Tax=Mycolicibacterium sphagni TaxID=1786 RepID=UPI0021F31265|nr:hypothetical protein [Mycolicibacterium sphagni]MCV7174804.1 hypothetical protein [Mycolicibacterium sphagni]
MRTLTSAEYEAQTRHNYAGTVATLAPETVERFTAANPDWDGKHWAIWWDDGGAGTTLGPINVCNLRPTED